ncbi:ALI_HP2_G0013040.mRNA.1.CDS.1 [Saccharomyces cerevisiae]|nr:ALI_HP2_G0013040.mRNA.1.CDS.1 [Saccharomyces cerevisiae]CAI6386530.1 ALI_HP1_G0001460.mRNA.1.CDS.1 [Saccharomyces cerevisiae]CAI6458004.1 ALI_HP2_G0013040.mRNA.1.CDS.1 [Saccharomyces cerevisiae]
MTKSSGLYEKYPQENVQKKSKHLLGYGAKFAPMVITKAKGSYMYAGERKILDFTSGQMSTLLGHGHPEICETISEHAYHLDHLFSGMLSPPVLELAEKLTGLLPKGLDRAMFLSTGSEANEAAIKLAKVYTGRFEVVGLSLSWHGMTGVSGGTTYQDGRKNHGPSMPGNLVLPAPNAYRSIFRKQDGTYDWETEMDYGFSLIDAASVGSLAAVIVEPVMSSGGMIVLPDGYLKRLQMHCKKRGMLLIVDEAQTAIGRCGAMFGFEAYDVVPDILTLSKTLGNGLPLSAVVTSDEIAQKAAEERFLFYTTHVNDPLPCAVGSKVLDIVIRDNLVENSAKMGDLFRSELKKLQTKYKQIGDIRGRGLMTGVEIIKPETGEADGELAGKLADRMMELGLSANLISVPAFGGVFRIAPPVTISKAEIMQGVTIFNRSFEEFLG